MRYYETIFIANPDLSDEEYQAVLTRTREVIEKHKGVFVKLQEWGKQRLAYPIKRQDKGTYVLLNYCGEGGTSLELERFLKLDERVLKSMTVKLEDAVDPEELLRKEMEAQEKPAPAGEDASDKEQEDNYSNTESTEGESNG
ncbi:MAG: 30S ribosomal protein S6 [Thermodesulfobacteriota bacterium]